jgi:hypothetical protein
MGISSLAACELSDGLGAATSKAREGVGCISESEQ